jgi:MOSC domain-containing protein YiiM
MPGEVASVGSSFRHRFSKPPTFFIRLLAGIGVEGDAHSGATVKHRSRVERDPTQPNLRQVHLIHEELFAELAAKGFSVGAGDLGENLTTRGIDLLALPTGSLLRLGDEAVIRVTGLRNPCVQIDRFQPGLMKAVLGHAADGSVVRKSGVMAVVVESGEVKAGDAIEVTLPPGPHRRLECV